MAITRPVRRELAHRVELAALGPDGERAAADAIPALRSAFTALSGSDARAILIPRAWTTSPNWRLGIVRAEGDGAGDGEPGEGAGEPGEGAGKPGVRDGAGLVGRPDPRRCAFWASTGRRSCGRKVDPRRCASSAGCPEVEATAPRQCEVRRTRPRPDRGDSRSYRFRKRDISPDSAGNTMLFLKVIRSPIAQGCLL